MKTVIKVIVTLSILWFLFLATDSLANGNHQDVFNYAILAILTNIQYLLITKK
jgi:hypothetical protein